MILFNRQEGSVLVKPRIKYCVLLLDPAVNNIVFWVEKFLAEISKICEILALKSPSPEKILILLKGYNNKLSPVLSLLKGI